MYEVIQEYKNNIIGNNMCVVGSALTNDIVKYRLNEVVDR
jgi:hypothetical protein